jgi:hypothetical protein
MIISKIKMSEKLIKKKYVIQICKFIMIIFNSKNSTNQVIKKEIMIALVC